MKRDTRRPYGLATLAIGVAAFGALDGLEAADAVATAPASQSSSAATASTDMPVQKAEERDRPLVVTQEDRALGWTACPPLFPPGCKLVVLHGNPADPGADVLFRVPAGYTIPAHWHTSAERMVLVSGQLDVAYAGHAPEKLNVGDYAYGPPKLPHVARCKSTTPCTLFIAFDTAVDAQPFEGTGLKAP